MRLSAWLDDIGLLPVALKPPRGLYRLVDAGYEKRSVAVSSILHTSSLDELMPNTLATATVDRRSPRPAHSFSLAPGQTRGAYSIEWNGQSRSSHARTVW